MMTRVTKNRFSIVIFFIQKISIVISSKSLDLNRKIWFNLYKLNKNITEQSNTTLKMNIYLNIRNMLYILNVFYNESLSENKQKYLSFVVKPKNARIFV